MTQPCDCKARKINKNTNERTGVGPSVFDSPLLNMKAIVTVVGKDAVGIIAAVCVELASYNVNVLDISQTVMQGYFTMMMAVDVSESTVPLAELAKAMEKKGKEMNLSIRLQREDIFEAMHRV